MNFTARTRVPVPADELFQWHARPGAFQRLTPPWEKVRVADVQGPFADGHRVTLRANIVGPVVLDWVAEVYGVEPGRQFRDRELTGPFAEWDHTHRMTPAGPDASFLEDDITFRLPFGLPGRVFGAGLVRRRLTRMFAFRHRVTVSDLRRHAAFRGRPRLTIAVTGSRGLIGSELVPFLTAGGHNVIRLVTGDTTPPFPDGTTWLKWDPASPLPPGTLAGVDAVVHLAAEGIADGRWTRAKRQRIIDSRVIPTRHLAYAAAAAGVKVFASASGVAAYGDRGADALPESEPAGGGFLADVCRDWEAAAACPGARVVNLRIGVVLTPRGGFLGKQLRPFRCGVGAVLGTGTQYVPWIGMADTVAAIHHCLMTDSLSGPVNVVGPAPLPNRAVARAIAAAVRRPLLLTAPAFALRTLFGDITDAALLASLRAVPAKLLAAGFTFDAADPPAALADV